MKPWDVCLLMLRLLLLYIHTHVVERMRVIGKLEWISRKVMDAQFAHVLVQYSRKSMVLCICVHLAHGKTN